MVWVIRKLCCAFIQFLHWCEYLFEYCRAVLPLPLCAVIQFNVVSGNVCVCVYALQWTFAPLYSPFYSLSSYYHYLLLLHFNDLNHLCTNYYVFCLGLFDVSRLLGSLYANCVLLLLLLVIIICVRTNWVDTKYTAPHIYTYNGYMAHSVCAKYIHI